MKTRKVQPPVRRVGGRKLALAWTLTAALGLATWAQPARAGEASKIPALFESSFAYEATGDYARALNDTLQVLRQAPDHYLGNLRAGWLYYLKGRYADAVKRYEKAQALAPKAIEPKLGAMLPLMAAKRWGEAEALGKAVLARAPHNYTAGSRLAFIAFSLGRYKEAERRYRAVLEDFPSDTEMTLGLAWTYVRQGRTAEARALFQQVLEVHRKNVNAQAGLDALGK